MHTVGILSLQGAFNKHAQVLERLKVDYCYVKYPTDLINCKSLIIPGGESSSLTKLILKNNLYDYLRDFAENKPVFGTCAGLIILSKIDTALVKGLGILDINIRILVLVVVIMIISTCISLHNAVVSLGICSCI